MSVEDVVKSEVAKWEESHNACEWSMPGYEFVARDSYEEGVEAGYWAAMDSLYSREFHQVGTRRVCYVKRKGKLHHVYLCDERTHFLPTRTECDRTEIPVEEVERIYWHIDEAPSPPEIFGKR